MDNETNLSQNTVESPSAVGSGNAQEIAEAGLLDFATNFVVGDQPQEEVVEKEEETQQSEEISTEQEELVETEADDTEIDVEVEDADEEEVVDQEVDSDKLALSFTDFMDQVGALEIGGKEYTPAQLKSILGQEESAGTKARKAAEELAKVEAAKKELAEQEIWLKKRTESVAQSDELAKLANQYTSLNAQYQKALSAEDSHQMTILDGKMKNVANRYKAAQGKVQEVQREAQQRHLTKVASTLETEGYGNLLKDTPEATAWKAYATKVGLDESGMFAAVNTPQLAIALEKARRFDELNSSKGKVLKSKGKILKSSGNKIQNTKTKAETARKQRLAQGKITDSDANDYFLNLAKTVLS